MPMPRSSFKKSASPTWSFSRDARLQVCERKYYYHDLSKARIDSSNPRLRDIALLKKLKSAAMWRGDCVHWVIARCLSSWRAREQTSNEEWLEQLRGKIGRDWLFSESRQFRFQPAAVDRAGVALIEHEYDEVSADLSPESTFEAAGAQLRAFFVWAQDCQLPLLVRNSNRLWIEPPMWGADAPGFVHDGVQVLTKVDLACEHTGESFVIFDWKTDRPPHRTPAELTQHQTQVGMYQLWAHLTLGWPLDKVSSRLVYLGGEQATEETVVLDDEGAGHVLRAVSQSIRHIKRWEAYFENGDLDRDDLDYAPNPNECRQCGFKRLCRESLQAVKLL